jgi:hypothetical protein
MRRGRSRTLISRKLSARIGFQESSRSSLSEKENAETDWPLAAARLEREYSSRYPAEVESGQIIHPTLIHKQPNMGAMPTKSDLAITCLLISLIFVLMGLVVYFIIKRKQAKQKQQDMIARGMSAEEVKRILQGDTYQKVATLALRIIGSLIIIFRSFNLVEIAVDASLRSFTPAAARWISESLPIVIGFLVLLFAKPLGRCLGRGLD